MPTAPLSLAISLWGGAPAPVVTQAFSPQGVQIHRDFSLKYAANALAASAHGVAAFWLKGSAGSASTTTMTGSFSLAAKMVFGNYSAAGSNAEQMQGANFTFDPGKEGILRLNLNDSTGTGGSAHAAGTSLASPAITNASWEHWLWVWATDFASGSKRGALLKNGVPVVTGIGGESIGSFLVDLHTLPFYINAQDTNLANGSFELAQFALYTPTDMTTLPVINGSSVVTSSVINKFYNGGPVDLGSDGTAPGLGAPIIFHDGAVATWKTNKGSLGDIATVLGTGNANTAKPYAAALSPGATPTAPYCNWWSWDSNAFSIFNDTTHTCSSVNSFGNPIVAGDVLVMVVTMQDSGATDRSPVVTGWTLASKSSQSSGGSTLTVSIYYKVAASTDATPHGNDWGVGGGGGSAPTITWAAGASLMNATYHLFNFKNATGTVVGQVTGHAAAQTGTNFALPAVTASANSLLVNGIRPYDWLFEPTPAPGAGQNLRFKSPSGVNDATPYIFDETIVSAGSTGGRAWTATGTIGNPYIGFSFNVQ